MAHLEVIPASPDQEPILANLLELYAHDFSEFHDLRLAADGRFGYQSLALYWREPHRHPFLIRLDGNLAGLVLVRRISSANGPVWDMAEFFVMRGYRRRGMGTRIATQIWRRFPGPWEVRVMEANRSALQFWERAISAFAGEPIHPARFEKRGKFWLVFSFTSGSASPPDGDDTPFPGIEIA